MGYNENIRDFFGVWCLDTSMETESQKSEVDRLLNLIAGLKKNIPVLFSAEADQAKVWRVSFRGEPSYRHMNRICMFRDFLDSLLPGGLETVGGECGSVVVMFGPQDVDLAEFSQASIELLGQQGQFNEVAQMLGISYLEYSGKRLEF